jgi:hypothetical protein
MNLRLTQVTQVLAAAQGQAKNGLKRADAVAETARGELERK